MVKKNKINQKMLSLSLVQKSKIRKARQNTWTTSQQSLYLQFLKKNQTLMKNQETRRAFKVFKMMSGAIESRSSVQIKAHHQKLELKYQTISNIIHHVELIIKKALLLSAQQQTNKLIQSSFAPESTLNDIIEIVEFPKQEREQVQLISSGSFFDEYSQNYGKIDCGLILDQNQPII